LPTKKSKTQRLGIEKKKAGGRGKTGQKGVDTPALRGEYSTNHLAGAGKRGRSGRVLQGS